MADLAKEKEVLVVADGATETNEETIKLGENLVEEVRAKLEGAVFGEKVGKEDEKKEGSKVGEERMNQEVEPKTGISFPVKLDDGKQLGAIGLRKKKILGVGITISAFGIYADSSKLKELLNEKFSQPPPTPSKELYDAVIETDIGMAVRMVIVFRGLTMNLVRKNFDVTLGASLKKLTGGEKNDELMHMIMGAAKDNIKLSAGSKIEISRSPGYALQTKVKDEVISKVENELLCRAYFHMYLGDDPFDKEAKERFGEFLLSLF